MSQSHKQIPILISYHYLITVRDLRHTLDAVMKHTDVPIMIDSGAFTAHRTGKQINLGSYIEACKHYLSHKSTWGCVMLDVIGDKVKTRKNLMTMVKAGVKPMPVITVDAPVADAVEYATINSKMCVAGALGSFTNKDLWVRNRYKEIHEAVPTAQLHGLGYVRTPQLYSTDLASCDSSSHNAGERYGITTVFTRHNGLSTLKNYDKYADRCGLTKADMNDHYLMKQGAYSFCAFTTAHASALQSIFCKQHTGKIIFQALANCMAWGKFVTSVLYTNGDGSYDFWKARKKMKEMFQPRNPKQRAMRFVETIKEAMK